MSRATVTMHQAPQPDINMTPLIDVMLVLIVMLIITIPMQDHAVKMDLPTRPTELAINPHKNLVTVTESGAWLWNGRKTDRPELAQLLVASTQLESLPELHIQPDGRAPYGAVDELLVTVRRAGVDRFGFIGNEAHARF